MEENPYKAPVENCPAAKPAWIEEVRVVVVVVYGALLFVVLSAVLWVLTRS